MSHEVLIDGVAYVRKHAAATSISTMGMFDCHLFQRIDGATVDEVIANWMAFNAQEKYPAIVGGRPVDDLGRLMLCPAHVLDAAGKELRRVGVMVFPDDKTRQPKRPEELEAYRAALLADPDIPRLLAERSRR